MATKMKKTIMFHLPSIHLSAESNRVLNPKIGFRIPVPALNLIALFRISLLKSQNNKFKKIQTCFKTVIYIQNMPKKTSQTKAIKIKVGTIFPNYPFLYSFSISRKILVLDIFHLLKVIFMENTVL